MFFHLSRRGSFGRVIVAPVPNSVLGRARTLRSRCQSVPEGIAVVNPRHRSAAHKYSGVVADELDTCPALRLCGH
jgi:hypothetical protein